MTCQEVVNECFWFLCRPRKTRRNQNPRWSQPKLFPPRMPRNLMKVSN